MSSEESSSDDDAYGPLPPSGYKPSVSTASSSTSREPPSAQIIGPILPSHLSRDDLKNLQEESVSDSDDDIGPIGPFLPEDESSLIPRPSVIISTNKKLEKPKREKVDDLRLSRKSKLSKKFKRLFNRNPLKLANINSNLYVQEWMLVPPKNREISGLGPRKFLTRNPEDSNKVDEHGNEVDEDEDFTTAAKRELKELEDKKRDHEMSKKLSGKDGTKESLLSIHRKKRKLEKDEKDEPAARKPFDREKDLAVCKMTEKDRNNYIKKSQEIASRFSAGKKKFL